MPAASPSILSLANALQLKHRRQGSRELVDRLASGYELLEVVEFEEGALPRRLLRATPRKSPA